MKINFNGLVIGVVLLSSTFAFAQETKTDEGKFSPSGKPIVTVYSDFSVVNSNGNSNAGFEVARAYLGYGYHFSKNFSGTIVYDITNKDGQSPTAYTAFLKKAYAGYSNDNFQVSLGLMSTTSFKLQESIWGKRYLYKSLQDEYSYESSADLGVSTKWQVSPKLSADLSVFNGEGYKMVQIDSVLKVAVGLTFEPVKHFYGRLYYDYMSKELTQSTFNVFLGYKSDKGSVGAEYNMQNNRKMVADQNITSMSFYGTLAVAKKLSVFGRFDKVMSDKIGTAAAGWNTTDGQVYIAGVEFFPVKGIQVSPNIRYSDLTVGNSTTSVFINLGMSF